MSLHAGLARDLSVGDAWAFRVQGMVRYVEVEECLSRVALVNSSKGMSTERWFGKNRVLPSVPTIFTWYMFGEVELGFQV